MFRNPQLLSILLSLAANIVGAAFENVAPTVGIFLTCLPFLDTCGVMRQWGGVLRCEVAPHRIVLFKALFWPDCSNR